MCLYYKTVVFGIVISKIRCFKKENTYKLIQYMIVKGTSNNPILYFFEKYCIKVKYLNKRGENLLKKIYDNGGNYIVFFLVFNLIFALFGLSIKYATPFLISLLLTVWIQPLAKIIHKKTKANMCMINIFCILLSLFSIIGVLSLIGVGMFKETSSLIAELSNINIDFLMNKLDTIKIYAESISPEVLSQIIQYIQSLAGNIISYISVVGNWIIKIAGLVPTGVINLIIIILSTYYLMRDYDSLTEKFENFKIGKSELPKKLLKRANSIIINYIQSYSILLSITFIECLIVFSIFDVKYIFTLSIICVLLDILPIIGTTLVYVPIATIFIIQGKIWSGIIILLLYCLFVVIRNVMEPKLLSKSLEIHPVLILMSIYVGVSLAGIMGVIYCIFLIAYFKLLKEVNVI